jgi:hypothetical protein
MVSSMIGDQNQQARPARNGRRLGAQSADAAPDSLPFFTRLEKPNLTDAPPQTLGRFTVPSTPRRYNRLPFAFYAAFW